MLPHFKRNVLFFAVFISCALGDNSTIDDFIYKNVHEDGRLNFTELAIKYGQSCKEHNVTTEDGYVLTLFNIPGDKTRPVFLMHGIIDSADTYIIRGNTSFAITLARAGYDVWVGNLRGNKYARSHVTLDVDKDRKKFWNFTLQELGVYDLSAMIDYVLNATGQDQLQAFGHSQGNTIFYILASERPEYNKKIKLFVALAPICYLHHVKSFTRILVGIAPLLSTAFKLINQWEILPPPLLRLKTLVCSQPGIGYTLCARGLVFPIAGSDPEELEPEFFRTVIGRYPDTAGVRNADHLVQIAFRKKFAKFDHGPFVNLREYGSVSPPNYALNNVTMPIALIAGENDNLSALEDVAILKDELANVVFYHVMERKEFNHLDYVWGKHMPEYLFPMLLDLLKNVPQNK